jgi:hypothetical protein
MIPKLITILFLCLSNSIFAQINFQNVYRYEKEFTYTVILPIDYDKNKKYSLAIGLHGLFGDGSKMLSPFSYYSRYMDIILVCPDGNILDTERRSVKWGYDKSEKFLLDFRKHIQKKYNVYEDVLLFGFSQGANQGLTIATSKPETFKYFAGISGGYTNLSEKQIINSSKISILFQSGDTGEGEVYTKTEMDNRFQVLQKINSQIERKVYPGLRHEVSFEEAFDMFAWFFKVSKRKNSLKEDYFPSYQKSIRNYFEGKLEESIQNSLDSISKNPDFVPNYFNLSLCYFHSGKINLFKENFFSTLEYYSYYKFFDTQNLHDFFVLIKETEIDYIKKVKLIDFFQSEMKARENQLSDFIKAEMNLLIAEIFFRYPNKKEAKKHFLKSLLFFDKLKLTPEISQSKLYISEYLNLLSEK